MLLLSLEVLIEVENPPTRATPSILGSFQETGISQCVWNTQSPSRVKSLMEEATYAQHSCVTGVSNDERGNWDGETGRLLKRIDFPGLSDQLDAVRDSAGASEFLNRWRNTRERTLLDH